MVTVVSTATTQTCFSVTTTLVTHDSHDVTVTTDDQDHVGTDDDNVCRGDGSIGHHEPAVVDGWQW